MELESQPGFLGTSIQFAEQQIKLLEQEYADQQERNARELIDTGFLDTDYEGSDGDYESETESDPESQNESQADSEIEFESESDSESLTEQDLANCSGLSCPSSFDESQDPFLDDFLSRGHELCGYECGILWDEEESHEDETGAFIFDEEHCVDHDEELVIEHLFQRLDRYQSADDDLEEELTINMECTIYTVLDEGGNHCQYIVDGEPVIKSRASVRAQCDD